MTKRQGRRPDYIVNAKIRNDTDNTRPTRIGAAWKTIDHRTGRERISITLDPFVVLRGDQDLIINLFQTADGDS